MLFLDRGAVYKRPGCPYGELPVASDILSIVVAVVMFSPALGGTLTLCAS